MEISAWISSITDYDSDEEYSITFKFCLKNEHFHARWSVRQQYIFKDIFV